jgi:hypothetical protein
MSYMQLTWPSEFGILEAQQVEAIRFSPGSAASLVHTALTLELGIWLYMRGWKISTRFFMRKIG